MLYKMNFSGRNLVWDLTRQRGF